MDRSQHIQIHRSAVHDPKPLPVGPDVIQELVQTARVNRGTVSGKLERHDVRLDVDPMPVVLSVIHPGGTHSSAEGMVYDIGPGGAGLLYPGFLYVDAECMLHMKTTNQEPVMLDATVAWCRFLSRGIHCVGLKWRERIDVRRFVPSSMWSELSSVHDEHLKAEISGRVLCIGAAALEVELVRLFLSNMPVEVQAVDSGGAAIDTLHQASFDLLILDGENDEIQAEDLLARLRQEGFAEPALILTDRRSAQPVSPGDSVRYVPKPLEADVVLAAVREIMLAHANPMHGSGPIESSLAKDPKMASAIAGFVKHAKAQIDTIRGGLKSDNFAEVRKAVVLLHNTASGFGFGVLTDVAGEAIKALDASGSALEAAPTLKLLVRVLERLKAPEAPATTAA
ncbi:MAG: hypothetical protein KatS3mg103_0088 [Phycisphaerales bacterium]|nr:MAG: hypothetical protein KatS3mg103_0088 [Phycisphaerales bacterium]